MEVMFSIFLTILFSLQKAPLWSSEKKIKSSAMESVISVTKTSLSSGATSSIFHLHAEKKCCAAHGYKMLHVAHQLNTAANSIFAALFCFFDHKIHFSNTISSWPMCMTNICRKFFVYYITICLLKKSITS